MKRAGAIFVLALLLIVPSVGWAATSMLSTVTVEVIHADAAGEGVYYLDLFAPSEPEDVPAMVLERDGEEIDYYTRPLLEYERNGWVAAYRHGRLMLDGALVGEERDGNSVHFFEGIGVPRKFSIIVQRPDGMIAVSNVVDPGQKFARVRYDMATNQASVVFQWGDGLIAFFVRLLIMVGLDAFIAIRYFHCKRPYAMVFVSLFTKSLFNIALAMAYPYSRLITIFVFLLSLLVLLPLEYVLHYVFQKEMDSRTISKYVAVSGTAVTVVGVLPYLLGW